MKNDRAGFGVAARRVDARRRRTAKSGGGALGAALIAGALPATRPHEQEHGQPGEADAIAIGSASMPKASMARPTGVAPTIEPAE